jgi:hypothetical protein
VLIAAGILVIIAGTIGAVFTALTELSLTERHPGAAAIMTIASWIIVLAGIVMVVWGVLSEVSK